MSRKHNWRHGLNTVKAPFGRTATMASWLLAGKSLAEVSSRFGVQEQSVRTILNRATLGGWLPTLGEYIADYNEIVGVSSQVRKRRAA